MQVNSNEAFDVKLIFQLDVSDRNTLPMSFNGQTSTEMFIRNRYRLKIDRFRITRIVLGREERVIVDERIEWKVYDFSV